MLTIYKASAGSGKTYTLALQYIKLLLGVRPGGTDRYVLNSKSALTPLGMHREARRHAHILAITFTNKATAEMKSRIIDELYALAHPDEGKPSGYTAALMAEFGCSQADLADAAGRALTELLFDYGSFNVSTIDSFFQTVLRTFAREIDRQGDYRVEMRDKYVLAAAVGLLFDDLNDPDPETAADSRRVTDWLSSRATTRVSEGKDFNPFYRGGPMYGEMIDHLLKTFNEQFARRADEVHEFLAEPARLKNFAAKIDSICANLGQQLFDATGKVLATGAGFTSNMTKLLQNFTSDLKFSSKDFVNKFLFPTSKYLKNLAEGVDDGAYLKSAKATDYPALFAWYRLAAGTLVRVNTLRAIRQSLNGLWALSYINDYINRFRTENNLILLSDTTSLLRSIIRDDETPFIYERLGQPLQHFLIDEFQDTSLMQWSNLRPLVGNSLADEHESLIIGDVKQSIYRWRGADSTLLDTTVETGDFPHQSVVRGAAPGENTNYRSAHAVVRFNNTLFSRLAATHGVRGYGGIEQSLAKPTAGLSAHITVTRVDSNLFTTNPALYFTEEQTARFQSKQISFDPYNIALERMATEILAEHERGYRWSEIAIICRTHKGAARVVSYLLEHYPQIRVMSDEALLVANNASVKLIVSFLEMFEKASETGSPLLENEKQDAGEPQYFSQTDAEILVDRFEYFISHGREPHEALADAMDFSKEAAAGATNSLPADIAYIRSLAPATLPALVEAIIMRKIPEDRRQKDLPYIIAFMDEVTAFTEESNPSVHAFLDYWRLRAEKATISSGVGQDAVAVTTVHSAKGLEWDCVHIPLMNWNLTSLPGAQWFTLDDLTEIPAEERPPLVYLDPAKHDTLPGSPIHDQVMEQVNAETADNLNVAYVAFTRAVRELHIHTMKARNGSSFVEPLWDAITLPQLPEETGEIYAPLASHTIGSEFFDWGEPTTPVRKKEVANAHHLPAPQLAIAFTQIAKQVAQLDDLTTSDSAFDPFIGGADADPLESAVEPLAPAAPSPLLLARNRGLNLHAILARMTTLDDLDNAIAAEEARLLRDPAGVDYYREVIVSAFRQHMEETDRWFGPDTVRVLSEQPIFVPDREENFRPDRIVWTADGHIDIIDYKFTTEPHDTHRSQVLGYVRLLTSMGYTGVRGFVWYPELRRITGV